MMLRWRIWLTARASAMKRETICGSTSTGGARTLIATLLADERVDRAIHRAEAALAELRLDPVLADDGTRRELHPVTLPPPDEAHAGAGRGRGRHDCALLEPRSVEEVQRGGDGAGGERGTAGDVGSVAIRVALARLVVIAPSSSALMPICSRFVSSCCIVSSCERATSAAVTSAPCRRRARRWRRAPTAPRGASRSPRARRRACASRRGRCSSSRSTGRRPRAVITTT